MRSTRYVALLRGINVGGQNPVAMSDLRILFEEAGHREVSTYINSGNVLFVSAGPARALGEEIELELEKRLGYPLVVVVRSHMQLRRLVDHAPDGFGQQPETFHSDVAFLRAPLSSKQAMRVVELREGVDEAWPGAGVIYYQRLSEQRTKSKMGRIVGTPEYKQMTIRSWTTTVKLLDLLDERVART